jgi:hypothetical protein
MRDEATIQVEAIGFDEALDRWELRRQLEVKKSSGFDGTTLLAISANVATIAQFCWDLHKTHAGKRKGTYRFKGKVMTGLTFEQMAREAEKDAATGAGPDRDVEE